MAEDVGDASNSESAHTLNNASPQFVDQGISTLVDSLQVYGWYIVIGAVVSYLVWDRLKPSYYKWIRSRKEQQRVENIDPEKAYQIQQSIEAARRRMQEKVAADAERFKERQKMLEEQKRQEKIENWENYQQGKGFKAMLAKRPEDAASSGQNPLKAKSAKPLRKPDYNPLTGQSSSASFRPARRDVSGGGG